MIKSQHWIIILGILLLGCKSTQNTKNNVAPIFTMEKTTCMGPCPSWVFKLYPNGNVAYIGREHVDRIGDYSAKLSEEALSNFRNMLEDASFFKYADTYYEKVTDLPTTYLYYNNGEKSKKIMDYYGAPKSLKALEKDVERFIESINWQKN